MHQFEKVKPWSINYYDPVMEMGSLELSVEDVYTEVACHFPNTKLFTSYNLKQKNQPYLTYPPINIS